MKGLTEYIIEKILINKNSKFINKIKVKSREQLQSIIQERYDKNKSFIDLTDIDISELDNLSSIFCIYLKLHSIYLVKFIYL